MTDPQPVRFLYVGQIRREKGVEDIVAAAQVLLDQPLPFQISIAGPIAGWTHDTFAPEMVERVRADASLDAVVSFLDTVENVDAAYQAHDIHLAPSIVEESYGLVVVEAKQNARLSIIYPSGGMVELIERQVDGLICETKSADCLAAAMLHFLSNPSEISAMGNNARVSLERLGLVRDRFTSRWASVVAGAAASGRRRA